MPGATSVPSPTFGANGFVAPPESAVLAGVQADINAAFGGNVNPSLSTPQGQLATSETAIIGNNTALFLALANGVDPAYATGRMQDAIARIYFLERFPDRSTFVTCTCIGLAGTIIPPGALALAEDGNLYFAVSGGTIPAGGSLSLSFACQTTGPIPCPARTLDRIFQAIPGWDTISNPADGVLGEIVETRAAFEARRAASVAANSVGFLGSVLGSVLSVAGVLDAYVTENTNAYQIAIGPAAVVTGSITGTVLTVSAVISGAIVNGMTVTGADGTGAGTATGTLISSFGSGTGGTGTYNLNHSQSVASTTLDVGGVVLSPTSLYVAADGGDQTAVATAIWKKKSPGCGYTGNTTVTVYDTSAQYTPPGIAYSVTYEIPTPLPFVVGVNIADSPAVPSNAAALIQNAIIAAFSGSDGGTRASIGSTVFANRFYAGITALGSWAEIVSLFLGTQNSPAAVVTASIGASFTATGSGTNPTVSAVAGGLISTGDALSGTGVPAGTTILSQTSGTPGGIGVYVTSVATTASSAAVTSTSTVLDVSAVGSGTLAVGQVLFGTGVADGTRITAQLSGSAGSTGTYRLSAASHAASETVDAVAPTLTRVPVPINQTPTVTAADIIVSLV